MPKTVTVDGAAVESKGLASAVSGLCRAREQVPTDPRAAKATYEKQSRPAIADAGRALRPSYSVAAEALAQATADVDADVSVDPPRPTLAPNLSRLIEVARQGLARLGIATPACEE